ncbi:MAG: F0F1 ATP synthase subunit A [Geodermatophilaceae bacterium]|nr:F0F1 ATP synthase subunit A [Geodermatophilaceae bacterium]
MAADFRGRPAILASESGGRGEGYEAPTVEEFFPPPLFEFSVFGLDFEITRITIISWIAVAALILLFFFAARRARIVPGKLQFFGEMAYNLIRDGVGRDVIGKQAKPFIPYLATLFFFILFNNLMGIIPFAQISPSAKIAYPAFMAILSYLLYLGVGIKRHGFFPYFKGLIVVPGVPVYMHILLIPIEFLSNVIARPFTLAIRLFANMFAGHLLLVVFSLGAAYLLVQPNVSVIFAPVAFLVAIAMTFFEILVAALQAYVFTILTAVYLEESIAGGH